MKRNFTRFLQPVFALADQNKQKSDSQAYRLTSFTQTTIKKETQKSESESLLEKIPPEFDAKEFVSFLLHINSEIEHGLMVQYLYAAYSLGGDQVPEESREQVKRWQEVILGIAKEEMGHLISCQNVLRLIGAPLNFGRDDYPWDSPFYPFPFSLEPLSLNSLAKYVYAESPAGWVDNPNDPIAVEIKEKVGQQTNDPHRVGALFEFLIGLVSSPDIISDEYFQANTYPAQAKFSEWGRGYTEGNRGNTMQTKPLTTPDVLVMPLMSRDDAINALNAIAEQGEAKDDSSEMAGSHFQRFLHIYMEFRKLTENSTWTPTRNVAFNPFVSFDHDSADTNSDTGQGDCLRQEITNPEAQKWAGLFNLRYRMLLNFLSHSFLLDAGSEVSCSGNARGAVIAATFGEMYNLRSIANVLVRLPLRKDDSSLFAGPPFMMPYTLDLPAGERNRWLQHIDLIKASNQLTESIGSHQEKYKTYLLALREADTRLVQLMETIIKSPNVKK